MSGGIVSSIYVYKVSFASTGGQDIVTRLYRHAEDDTLLHVCRGPAAAAPSRLEMRNGGWTGISKPCLPARGSGRRGCARGNWQKRLQKYKLHTTVFTQRGGRDKNQRGLGRWSIVLRPARVPIGPGIGMAAKNIRRPAAELRRPAAARPKPDGQPRSPAHPLQLSRQQRTGTRLGDERGRRL